MSSELRVDTIKLANGNTATASGLGIDLGNVGKVLQIVQQSSSTRHATTSTSYTEVITKAITPISASSTIYVKFATRTYTAATNTEHEVQLLRDTTVLDTYRGMYTTSGATAQREFWDYYDSAHSTTSSITYKFQHRTMNGSEVQINPNGAPDGDYYLTLMEYQA